MKILIYNVSDDPRVLKKNLGQAPLVTITNATARNPMNAISPTFLISVNSYDAFSKWNYLYVEELRRYYFIDSVTAITMQKYELKCTEDVGMTYYNDIIDSDVIVFNQSSDAYADHLISDSRLPMQVNTESRSFNFKKGELEPMVPGNWCYYLACFAGNNSSGGA